jgi:hypothetical protein
MSPSGPQRAMRVARHARAARAAGLRPVRLSGPQGRNASSSSRSNARSATRCCQGRPSNLDSYFRASDLLGQTTTRSGCRKSSSSVPANSNSIASIADPGHLLGDSHLVTISSSAKEADLGHDAENLAPFPRIGNEKHMRVFINSSMKRQTQSKQRKRALDSIYLL